MNRFSLITNLLLLLVNAFCFGQWTQKGVDIDGEAFADGSGHSVSMPDANTVAIGAPSNDNINGYLPGHVRVYSWNGSSWIQKGVDIDGEASVDKSGWSVSMPDANTVAIGAPDNDNVNGTNAGHVRIYKWNGSSWIQKGTDINGEVSFDNSGYSVSMPDANTVAIGAPNNDNINGTNAGHVRIYSWNGSAWMQKGVDIDGEASVDKSGWSVSMPDANTVAIGAFGNYGNGSLAGHVRVYKWNGSTWVQKGVDIDGEASGDYSGYSVSMPDANTVAIGAPYNDNINGANSGHARVYSWNGSTWIQKGVDIDGEALNDNSGYSVSMPDANTVAIGARYNDNVNGSLAGHVRVYSWNGSSWIQKGVDIDGEALNDNSGGSVSMPNANTVAIGAPYNDNGNGANAGHVRIYEIPSTLPIELLFFEANVMNHLIELKWETSSEINNDYFTIERSKNGFDWEVIEEMKGAGNSSTILNYFSIDSTPYRGISYYRLKQTDFDGRFSYSNIESVNISNLINNQIEIYPNPTKDQISVIGNKNELATIVIYSLLGQNVTNKTTIQYIDNKVIINLTNLGEGIYYLKTKNTANKIYKQ